MCLCAPFSRIPLTCRASALYLFPFFYCCFLVGFLALLPAPFANRPLFSCCCLAFAFLNLLTSIVGQIGVFKRMDAALRGTVVLLVMENLMVFFIGVFVLVHLVSMRPSALAFFQEGDVDSKLRLMTDQRALALDDEDAELRMLAPAARPMGECLLKLSIETRWWIAMVASVMLIICSALTSCCLRAVAEFQAELDAEAFVEDARLLRDSERMMLLQASKGYGPLPDTSLLAGSDSYRWQKDSTSREVSPRAASESDGISTHRLVAGESKHHLHQQQSTSQRAVVVDATAHPEGDNGGDISTASAFPEDAHQIDAVAEADGHV
ncbi:hypothetical protein BESB_068570 [Besnoitia besnoiti]|uniref:Transmembrane protein n=1 Tax=Besnoitia besnoiti TaxID=94643 RepID=A0A2A9MC76_BESBE|nr:hypothetical protein BESB_068570 [Besnoitia besnoiti]PFH34824.1 hypothetical protein BESB_068570 [Besnoitia besnoiti]